MKNNKIFTSFLFLTFVLAGISYTFATENSFFNKQHNFSGSTLNIEFPKQDEIKTILEKQNNGETLTEEEQSTLDNLNSFKNNGSLNFKGRDGKQANNFSNRGFLTSEDKEALEALETQEEKDAFLEAKNAEAKTKLEEQRAKSKAQEDVIDKLLNLQTLTTEEELVRQEIVKEREERKAKFQEKE